ncbi:Regulator_of chromosome condensation 1/beta-lactamase-inhibitor protein II [Hexamita inflata]|uniref:Regulator_of chromosome condensation 1/beta-lactamase-inhibitor protein II n=1 Tax=Hexamita inflata TaxID=28002 RepID=A0ABP1HLI1_9EUKA
MTGLKGEQTLNKFTKLQFNAINVTQISTFLGATVITADNKIFGLGSNPNNVFRLDSFFSQPEVIESSGTIVKTLIGFSFQSQKYYTISLTSAQQILRDFDFDPFFRDSNESVINIFTEMGLDFVQTDLNLYFRGACDEQFCSVGMDGKIIQHYVDNWQKMLLPFPASSIFRIHLQSNGVLFHLHNKSVFAMGSNIHGRFCLQNEIVAPLNSNSSTNQKRRDLKKMRRSTFVQIPTLVLNDVDQINLGQFFSVYSQNDSIFVCGSKSFEFVQDDEFDGAEPTKSKKIFKQIQKIETVQSGIIVLDAQGAWVSGKSTEEGFIGVEQAVGFELIERGVVDVFGGYAGTYFVKEEEPETQGEETQKDENDVKMEL